MNYNINSFPWKCYKIGSLFQIVKGKRLTKADMKDGTLNFIGASGENNGITAKISNSKYIHQGGKITVSYNGSVGEVFYQEDPFWASDDVNVLYPNFILTKNIALFLLPILKSKGRNYAFVNKWTKEEMEEEMIYLPAREDGNPDFSLMEDYIKSLQLTIKTKLDVLESIGKEDNRHTIDSSKWRYYHLYDKNLFSIDSGTKLDKVKMTNYNPSVNFVGRANTNNGVTDYIDEIPGLKPYDAGLLTISLGGEYLGSCFVQDKQFYTSQNVNVLIPRHEMSLYAKMFISTVIFREGRLHYKAFVDELNRHMKRDFAIPLPSLPNGSPNFEYMDCYIKDRMNSVTSFLSMLEEIE